MAETLRVGSSASETAVGGSADLRKAVIDGFRWVGDAGTRTSYADLSGWRRDPALARKIAVGLAGLFRAEQLTVIMGIESTGSLLGGLVAQVLDVGLVVVHKRARQVVDSDPGYSPRRRLTIGTGI